MTQKIALRIQVGTLAGARQGVPHLLDCLQSLAAKASFFLSLGPDQSGRAFRQALGLRRHCWKTPLRGTLIPAGEIGRKAAEPLMQIEALGFEAGLSAWNRVAWEKQASQADNDWIAGELQQAVESFTRLFGHAPRLFAAPDWQANRHALRLMQRQGFVCASDCRGEHPFLPIWDGEPLPCPQLPTTLPTLEELLQQGDSPDAAVQRLTDMTRHIRRPQVFSLRAEQEALGHLDALTRIWQAWQAQGHELVSLSELAATLDKTSLPYAEMRQEVTPGRHQRTSRQGPCFLA